MRNTGPASLDAFVERECDCSSTGAPRAARRRCNCRRPERDALAARHGRTCTRSPCRGCPCCGDALDGSPCLRYRPCQAAGKGSAYAACCAHDSSYVRIRIRTQKAHAQCSFALSVTPSARMTSCYTSTILMRSGQHARGRHGAGAMVASSMLHSTIRSASA